MTRAEKRIEVARKRVRNSLSKMSHAELLEKAMKFYEERNAWERSTKRWPNSNAYKPSTT